METQKSSPRDILMHLLNSACLYISVLGALVLLFGYLNVIFPDKLNPIYDGGNEIRQFMAVLIIIFPVYLWTSRFIRKDLRVNPEKSDLRVRKWMVYLTLFASAVLVIGDLVALIYNFLQGEITTRFILKILSVLIIGAWVFGHYLYDLRRNPKEFSPKAKISVWLAIFAALSIVTWGFFVAGSPFKQRIVRFDEQRISDLQGIQSQIVVYWQQKNKLPQTLTDLNDTISGFSAAKDPETGADYSYKATGNLSFELCAKFGLDSSEEQLSMVTPYGSKDNWTHKAGDVCFKRNIDPELYQKTLVPAVKPGV